MLLSFKFGASAYERWKMDKAECQENGEALADVVDSLPFGIGEKLAEAGPMSRALTTVGGSILKRLEFDPKTYALQQHEKAVSAENARRTATNAAHTRGNVITIPRPVDIANPPPQGNRDIIIPSPPQTAPTGSAQPTAPMPRPEDILP